MVHKQLNKRIFRVCVVIFVYLVRAQKKKLTLK